MDNNDVLIKQLLADKKYVALILIDWQKGFDNLSYWGGSRNNLEAEKNAKKLLEGWRKEGLPVFHIQHSSSNPNSILAATNPGFAIKDDLLPLTNEPLLLKSVNSAFIGTNLTERLNHSHIQTVVLTGLTTDHCVSTTARMAANLGFQTVVAFDATAAFAKYGYEGEYYTAEIIHGTALAHLKGEFAAITSTQKILDAMITVSS